MKHRATCPICTSENHNERFLVKDHFLSQQTFSIHQCSDCGFKFTNPYPNQDSIGEYYQSENYLSHPDKKVSAFSIAYNLVKFINIRSKFRVATKSLKVGNVLDIGCGSGDFLHYAKKNGWNTTGIEPDEKARQFSTQRQIGKVLSPKDAISIPQKSFDLITLWHVLEHVDDLQEQIDQIKSWLKPGGRIVIALPNPDSFDAHYYGIYWAGWDVPRHLHHFSKDNILQLMKKNGFTGNKSYPMKWDAFYVSILSEKYAANRFASLKGILSGVRSNISAASTGQYSSLIYLFD